MAEICILGTIGTIPRVDHFLASALLRHNGHTILFDCGEGTQLAIKKAGYTFKSIDVICITHFHADHVTGLAGLLLTMGNEGREKPIMIIAPQGASRIINSLLVVAAELPFEIIINEVLKSDADGEIVGITPHLIDDIVISVTYACHTALCLAYSVYIKRQGKFDPQRAERLEIPLNLWNVIRKQGSVLYNDKYYYASDIMGEERRGIKFTYITDTRPCHIFERLAMDSDILVCEGMYGSDDKIKKAKETGHMVFSEAAALALKSNVSSLILTHFSSSMPEPEQYLENAASIFRNTACGNDGMIINVKFSD